jgi:hypothetical protein
MKIKRKKTDLTLYKELLKVSGSNSKGSLFKNIDKGIDPLLECLMHGYFPLTAQAINTALAILNSKSSKNSTDKSYYAGMLTMLLVFQNTIDMEEAKKRK